LSLFLLNGQVKFPYFDVENLVDLPKGCGISLTVGYVPGLKVDAIPQPGIEQVFSITIVHSMNDQLRKI